MSLKHTQSDKMLTVDASLHVELRLRHTLIHKDMSRHHHHQHNQVKMTFYVPSSSCLHHMPDSLVPPASEGAFLYSPEMENMIK